MDYKKLAIYVLLVLAALALTLPAAAWWGGWGWGGLGGLGWGGLGWGGLGWGGLGGWGGWGGLGCGGCGLGGLAAGAACGGKSTTALPHCQTMPVAGYTRTNGTMGVQLNGLLPNFFLSAIPMYPEINRIVY